MRRMMSVVVAVVASLVISSVRHGVHADTLSDGLVAYYPFDGNADDASANGLHGVVHGATPAANRFGSPDSAYWFDGINDYISVEDSDLLDVNEFTASVWFLADEGHPGSNYLLINGTDVTKSFRIYNVGGDTFTGDVPNPGRVYIDLQTIEGRWSHVALTYDYGNATMSIYVDGALAGTRDRTGVLNANSDPLYIGARVDLQGILSGFYEGYMDEIRIYDRSLSESEIRQLAFEGIETPMLMSRSVIQDCGSLGCLAFDVDGFFASDGFTIDPLDPVIDGTNISLDIFAYSPGGTPDEIITPFNATACFGPLADGLYRDTINLYIDGELVDTLTGSFNVPIPEPGTVVLLVMGGAMVMRRRG